MPSSCPIDYYKYHLFGSIVKMQKKATMPWLKCYFINEFVRIFNSSKLYICIIIFILFLFSQNNHYLIIITIAGCGCFFVVVFYFNNY